MAVIEFPKWVYSNTGAPQLCASAAVQAALPADYRDGPPRVAVAIIPVNPVSRVEPLVIVTPGNAGILSHEQVKLKDGFS